MKSKYNFTVRHYITIVFCFLLALLANASTSDSENVLLPLLAEANGWDYYGRVLSLVSIAGVVSVFGNLLLGKLCEHIGAKWLLIVSLVGTAGFAFLYGTAPNYILLLIGLIGTISCGQSIFYLGVNTLVANWFAQEKGLAMGFITMGPPVATIVMVSVLGRITRTYSATAGVYTVVAVLLIVAVLCLLFVREYPDKSTAHVTGHQTKQPQSEITLRDLLKSKSLWAIIYCIGACSIAQTGLMAQWLVRYKGTAFESGAAWMLSACAILGIFGSMLAGTIAHRMGTRKAYCILVVWFVVALILNFTNLAVPVYISVVMFGLIITLFQIFMPLFVLSAFATDDFKKANAIVFPISGLIGQLTFALIAACKQLLGEVRYAYLIYAFLLLSTLLVVRLIRADGRNTSRKNEN